MEKQNKNVILNTKLQKPFLPDDFIPRKKLLEYLNQNINRPLTLVSAGAGFGKSTFISSWLNNINFKNCWFSIDEQDNDIRTFLSYFIVSIQTIVPDFGTNIYRNIFSPNINSLDVLTNNFINELSDLHDDIIVVLDDFQNIKNLEITNLISNILKYPPKQFHIVIISRIDPPLPLYKLRAANKMKDIRSSHLRFNNNEIKIFLHNSLTNEDYIISQFNDKFEGWITGIRLLKIHLSYTNYNIHKLEKFINNINLSEIYFIEELIKHLDDKTLQFLLQTAVLQKFNSELADFVLSTKDITFNSENIVKDLLKRNLFLINLDENNKWFRYHHLFQDTLQNELNKNYNKQKIIKLHKNAVEWYIKNNLFEEAFYHILQIDNSEKIADFIRSNMYMPLNINKWFILEKWLKHIPDNIINKCPVLITAEMWVMQHKGLYWGIPELINKVEQIKDNNIKLYNSIKHQLVFFKAVINFWTGNIEESIEQFYFVKNKIALDKLGALSLSTIYFATASQLIGSGARVYKEIQIEISRNNLPVDYKIILLASLVYMKLLEGDLYTAEQITKQIEELSVDLNNNFYVAWYEFFMGYIALQQFRINEALSHYRNSLKLIYMLNTHAPIDAFAGVLITLNLTDNNADFEKINSELTTFVYEWSNPAYNTIAYSLKAHLALLNNNLQQAYKEFKKVDLAFNTKTIIFNIEVPNITYCKLLLTENTIQKTNKAINKLIELKDFVVKLNNIPQTIEILILLSHAYYKNENLIKALDNLTKAVILAEKGHIIYPFVEQAKITNVLLQKITSNNKNVTEFISLLITSISTNNNIIKIEDLSNRELDVINLLAQRLSNQDIADKLFISTSTVKRHTINIYRKFGVNKRQKAVEKAIKLNLIKI